MLLFSISQGHKENNGDDANTKNFFHLLFSVGIKLVLINNKTKHVVGVNKWINKQNWNDIISANI